MIVLREPVSRAISFFTYQKSGLRFPADYPIADYLAEADGSTPADFDDPDNEKYMAFRGGCYADFLPAWFDVLGTERVHVIDFDGSSPTRSTTCTTTAAWLGLDPARVPRRRPQLREPHHRVQEQGVPGLRAGGQRPARARVAPPPRRQAQAPRVLLPDQRPSRRRSAIPASVRAELAARYEEPNARLAQQLDAAGIALPRWLVAHRRSVRRAPTAKTRGSPRRRLPARRGEGSRASTTYAAALEHERPSPPGSRCRSR